MSQSLRLFFTCFIFSLLFSYAQADSFSIHWGDSIISKHKSYTEEDLLTQSFDAIIKSSKIKDTRLLQVIHKALLADLHSKKEDRKNKLSEQLLKEAVILANQTGNIGIQIWANTQFGYYYYTYSDYISALPYFLKTSRTLESYPVSKILEASHVFIKNAYFFGTIDDNNKSIEFLEKALTLTPNTSKEQGSVLYAIGALYLKKEDLDKAEHYFLRTIATANNTEDEVRHAKALGELAVIHNLRGEKDKAQRFLMDDIKISEKNGDQRNTMYAQIQLGKLYFEHGNIDKAEEIVKKALLYANSKPYLTGFVKEIIELQLKIAQAKHDDQSELVLRKKLDKIDQYLSITDGQEIVDKVNWETQKERIQWQLEAEQAKLEKSSLLKWTWVIVSFSLSVILILLFLTYKRRLRFQKVHFERKLVSFEFEKVRSEQILTKTHNTLSSYQVYLEEKNQQIDDLEKEIDKIKSSTDAKLLEQKISLESLLESHLMTDENWMLFKNAFISEKKDFYHEALTALPGLTESNLRIILLQKLGLNNQEVSHILGITTDAVKKMKQRMRKKYGDIFDEVLKESYTV